MLWMLNSWKMTLYDLLLYEYSLHDVHVRLGITMTFIDDSFKDLRSAKGAFELQQNFKEFQTRSSIQQLMVRCE